MMSMIVAFRHTMFEKSDMACSAEARAALLKISSQSGTSARFMPRDDRENTRSFYCASRDTPSESRLLAMGPSSTTQRFAHASDGGELVLDRLTHQWYGPHKRGQS